MKKLLLVMIGLLSMTATHAQNLQLNDLEYFERQGVNVLVFSNSFNGGFNDEKNSGIEIIHHGVRTVQGGITATIGDVTVGWPGILLQVFGTRCACRRVPKTSVV